MRESSIREQELKQKSIQDLENEKLKDAVNFKNLMQSMHNSAGIMGMHSGGQNLDEYNRNVFKTPEMGIIDQEANK